MECGVGLFEYMTVWGGIERMGYRMFEIDWDMMGWVA